MDLETVLKKIPELMREREENLDKRQKELEKLKAQLEEEHPNPGEADDVLSLNVGGTYISTLRRTLTQVEGSMLSSKFSGRWDDSIEKDAEGRFFLDQDMELFRPLVNYLRAVASQTLTTAPPASPEFANAKLQKDFNRMVDYYGMTLGIFPVGVYTYDHAMKGTLVASHPDFEVISEGKETFWLVPQDDVHKRQIKSFEVTMGPHTIAQIGWTDFRQRAAALKAVIGGYQGAGYTDHTMAFDSTRFGMVVNQQFTDVPGVTVENGTVIRCEAMELLWSFDGEMKVSNTNPPLPGTVRVGSVSSTPLTPCLTVKGSFRITNIEFDSSIGRHAARGQPQGPSSRQKHPHRHDEFLASRIF
jgi:hypothetical protein